MRLVTVLLAALVVVGIPCIAGAGDGRTGDPRVDQFIRQGTGIPPMRDPRADQFIDAPPAVPVPEHPRHVRPRADGQAQQNVIVVAPVVVPPATQCSSSGYWTYEWVPQTTTTQAWVPGHWAPNGTWVDAGWQTQTVATGYWQPLWVPDGSGC